MSDPVIVYRYNNSLYVNLTNRCPNACGFCIKHRWNYEFHNFNLALGDYEPESAAVIKELARQAAISIPEEVVFCGYGEPTMRLQTLIDTAKAVNAGICGQVVRVRLNTIGLSDMVWGKDTVDSLKGCVDSVCVSLNAANEKDWLRLVNPQPPYRAGGFRHVTDFIRRCALSGVDTVATAVNMSDTDAEPIKRLAAGLGAGFRLRPALSEGVPSS